MNGPLKFLTSRKILPLLDLLSKFKRVFACSCSPNLCVARKLAKQMFYFCSCSQKNRSARHARECSQRPFVTPIILSHFQRGGVDWHLPSLRSAFCLVDARCNVFCLEPLKQIALDLITLYPVRAKKLELQVRMILY